MIPAAIFVASLISFSFNGLLVSPDWFFDNFEPHSEQVVLDGIHHSNQPGSAVTLGRYSRPELTREDNYRHAAVLFDAGRFSGEFEAYRSQVGLQLYFFRFLHNRLGASAAQMQWATAALMALTVSLLFIALRREFSFLASVALCAALFTSPWVVVFARNLFFVEATWFWPMLASLFLGKHVVMTNRYKTLFLVLFLCFLLRFLCGLEYITAIVMSATVPLVYFTLKYAGDRSSVLLRVGTAVVSSAIAAFSLAIGLQAAKISDNFSEGLNHIRKVATRVLHSSDPEKAAVEGCSRSSRPADDSTARCVEFFSSALRASPLAVVKTYFAIPHFVPWAGRFNVRLDGKTTAELKESARRGSIQRVLSLLLRDPVATAGSVISRLTPFGFPLFLLLVVMKAASRSAPWRWRAMILLALLAPLSWFVIAKAHSYVHTHLNYVIWYLPFVPFAWLFLASRTRNASSPPAKGWRAAALSGSISGTRYAHR